MVQDLGFTSGPLAPLPAWIAAALIAIAYIAYTFWALPFIRVHQHKIPLLRLIGSPLSRAVSWRKSSSAGLNSALVYMIGSLGQIVLSGIVFGAFHFVWQAFNADRRFALYGAASTVVAGAALAIICLIGGRNLGACIAPHMLMNLVEEPWLVLAAISGASAEADTIQPSDARTGVDDEHNKVNAAMSVRHPWRIPRGFFQSIENFSKAYAVMRQPIDPPVAKHSSDKSFGKMLTKLREAKGLTQAEFAAKLAVSQVTIWKWENNKCFPKKIRLDQIAELLGTTSSRLTRQAESLESILGLSRASFGFRLSIIRKKRRVSLQKAGESAGVTGTCVWYWQRGVGRPSKDQIKKLADLLNVSVGVLAYGLDDGEQECEVLEKKHGAIL